MKTYTVKQNKLTSDCWMIQIQGIEACKECEWKNTEDCGGKDIIKQIQKKAYPANGIGEQISG